MGVVVFTDVLSVYPQNVQWNEVYGIQEAPKKEGPIGSMPNSTYQKNDEDIPDVYDFSALASSQWDVYIIFKP